jgi:hypothetical protein
MSPIFIDTSTCEEFNINPYANGLSDHDAQIICLNNFKPNSNHEHSKIKMRLINDITIMSFQLSLKDEMWYQVYASLGMNEAFNIFHDICLRYFESSFPIIYKNKGYQQKSWITMDINYPVTGKETCLNNTGKTWETTM